jgi:hypothetical protein
METFQAYLSYIGIGAALVGGIALVVWIIFAFLLSSATEGIPELLGKFFNYAAMGDFEQAYSLTTDQFQQSISQQQLRKLIQTNQIQNHKRILLPVSIPEGDTHTFDVTLVLDSGKEIPISVELIRQQEKWAILLQRGSANDALSFPRQAKKAAKRSRP